jgi:hypothetical protein
MLYLDHGIYIWEIYELYSAVTVETLYIYMQVCLDFGFCVRRSVYFLNIRYIRVFYRFNRNRALHL